jgi:lipid-A-disaccharide synthase
MVIVYRVSALTFMIARMLVDVKHIGLVNIVAGDSVVPELVQRESTPENIAEAMVRILDDAAYYKRIRKRLTEIRAQLGESGANSRIASIALEFLKDQT